MSVTTTLPQPVNFTRDDLTAAIKDARAKVQPGSAWARSIDRAERNLAAGRFAFYGEYVVLPSATSARRYTINTHEPMHCDCQDRTGKCWHVTASRLLVRAAERYTLRTALVTVTRPRMSEAAYSVACAAADELFA